jgi:UV DNA damage repair endonuclease
MALTKRIGGRQRGTPNRVTRAIREHFAEAFELLQEDKTVNLVSWAKANPTEFYRLASKLIPLQLETETQQAPQTIIQIVPDPYSAPITD